ncbi:hypothetical protein HDU98_009232 [Podochytrium sp. JEL0797]|nr:hypothetical protein HDU98_009232 [Podochytrium sp. JEL0797]
MHTFPRTLAPLTRLVVQQRHASWASVSSSLPRQRSDLPASSPHAVLPRKRPSGFDSVNSQDKVDASVLAAQVKDALHRIQPRQAWRFYKQLHSLTHGLLNSRRTDPSLLLSAEDHAQMLAALTQHLQPALAAVNAEMVILNFKRASYTLDVRDYNNLMLIYFRNNDLRSLVETFDALITSTYPPIRNKVSNLPPILKPLPAKPPFRRVVPNLRSYHLLMNAYASTGRVGETVSTFKQLTVQHPMALIDPLSHAFLINAYANSSRRTPQDLETVRGLFSTFQSYGTPDRRVLDAAVRGIGVCGDLESAKQLFAGYASAHGILEYSVESVDAMMSVLEVHGDCDGGEALFSKFFSVDSSSTSEAPTHGGLFPMPLTSTVKSLMRLNLAVGNSARVRDLFSRVLEATQLPDAEAYEILVNCLLRDGNLEEAQGVFERMQEHGYKIEQPLLEAMERANESAKYQ